MAREFEVNDDALVKIADVLKAVSSANKIKVLVSLTESPLFVEEVIRRTQLNRSLVSLILRDLRWKKLVERERVGSRAFYSLTPLGRLILKICQESLGKSVINK